MKYAINLVNDIRRREQQAQADRTRVTVLTALAFGVLALSLIFGTFDVLKMRGVIEDQKQKLARIETEYRKYKETNMIVDKADIELLDKLQNDRIFWTRKLAAMALHLPENYWITAFGYDRANYNVKGFGYISPEQEQLITLDDYLNQLRQDTTFCDNFRITHLNSTTRDDEYSRLRVNFDYASTKAGAY